jgi:hypothetical protein
MMSQRTVHSTITFNRPFQLSGFDEPFQAGTYKIETLEELVEGVSFPVWRRIETLLLLNQQPGQPKLTQVAVVNPIELEEARSRDEAGRDQQA